MLIKKTLEKLLLNLNLNHGEMQKIHKKEHFN